MEVIQKKICLEDLICRSPFLLKIEKYFTWDANSDKYILTSDVYDDVRYDSYYIKKEDKYVFFSNEKPDDATGNGNTIEVISLPKTELKDYKYILSNNNYYIWEENQGKYELYSEETPSVKPNDAIVINMVEVESLPKQEIEYYYVKYNNKYYTWKNGRYVFYSDEKPEKSNNYNTITYNPFKGINGYKYVMVKGNVKTVEILPETQENEYFYLLINKYNDKCWGNVIKSISVLGKKIDYKTFITIYNKLLNIVTGASYHEYDKSGDKWIKINYDWRKVFYEDIENIKYSNTFINGELKDRLKLGVISNTQLEYFKDFISQTIRNNKNGLDFLIDSHDKIGKIVTPPSHNDIYVPYFVYVNEIPKLINELIKIRDNKEKNCCYLTNYLEHGGDDFLNFLEQKKITLNDSQMEYNNDSFLNIPLLLTSKLMDLGQYRVYDVDEIDEESGEVINPKNEGNIKYTIVKTQGESKLKTLSKRKRSYDDKGNELPFIIDDIVKNSDGSLSIEISDIYKEGYIKNVSIVNSNMFGDTIYSTNIKKTPNIVNEEQYNKIVIFVKDKYGDKNIKNYISEYIPTKSKDENNNEINYIPINLNYTDTEMSEDEIHNLINENFESRISTTKDYYLSLFENDNKECYKIVSEYKYNVSYLKNGIIVNKEVEKNNTTYISYDNAEIEFIYVLGGLLGKTNNKITLIEIPPFDLNEDEYNEWVGYGIWYKETYPIEKYKEEKYTIEGYEKTFIYDKINFESKETTYTFEGIDFPRKNYILCEDIRYKSESYTTDCTYDNIFRDEKMMNLKYPLKEDYDVTITRGTSAAFERHLQLSDIKTWEDLESYRNGMFIGG